MDEKRKQDLEDVIKKETRRGRRPIDLDARRKRVEMLSDFRKLLTLATEEEFIQAMRAVGLRDGSPQFLDALKIWRDFRP
jgi:hypothetical protein